MKYPNLRKRALHPYREWNTLGELIDARPNKSIVATEVCVHIKNGHKHVVVDMEVKTGKKEVKIMIAHQVHECDHDAKVVYLTSLALKDIKCQFDDLRNEEIEPHCVTTGLEKAQDVQIAHYSKIAKQGTRIVFLVDECDYGSAKTQRLERFRKAFLDLDKIHFIYFSATCQELDFSQLTKSWPRVKLKTEREYRGISWFTQQNLVKEALPFFERKNEQIELSMQGFQEMQIFLADTEPVGVIRIAAQGKNDVQYRHLNDRSGRLLNAVIKRKFPNVQPLIIEFVDQENPLQWGRDNEKLMLQLDAYTKSGQKVLIILNQTCTRSTEVGFHKRISFWHDYRKSPNEKGNGGTPKNTIIQARRWCHYDPQGLRIRVYETLITDRTRPATRTELCAGTKGIWKVLIQRPLDYKSNNCPSKKTPSSPYCRHILLGSSVGPKYIHLNGVPDHYGKKVHELYGSSTPQEDLDTLLSTRSDIRDAFNSNKEIWLEFVKFEEAPTFVTTNKSMYTL